MCRRLPNGTYRYCPSRQRRDGSRTSGSGTFTVTDSGLIQHTGTLVPDVALDGVVLAAHTGADLSPGTVEAMSSMAAAPVSAKAKWDTWRGIAEGSSISAALAALKKTGWLQHFPELAAVDGVEQDVRWHPEGDVLTHLGLTGNHMTRQCEAARIEGDERTLLVLAATLHDLGKATHTHHHEDGRITSYGHDDAGVAPAHRFLASMDAPQRFHDVIEPLIKEHMCISSMKGRPAVGVVARLQRRLGPATTEQWVRVVNADHGGRGSASVDGYADVWLETAQRINEQSVEPHKHPGLVTGRHLIDAGLSPSPKFRDVITAARQAEDEGLIVDDASARAWLRNYLDR